MNVPLKLEKRLERRNQEDAIRQLSGNLQLTDLFSNDYLGLASSPKIFERACEILGDTEIPVNGATGSRLLSGNHSLYSLAEKQVANFHNSEEALIFNSGYDANVGFFSAVPQRGDIILYDELIHASIRDGISLSNARAFKFPHNDIVILKALVERQKRSVPEADIYIVTESVFSMDGDIAPLQELAEIGSWKNCFVIVDEAHATGVLGPCGAGLVQEFRLEEYIFARIHTFGKAMGCHGAVVLGSTALKDYLVNFARSFIYTTALPPHSVATIIAAYEILAGPPPAIEELKTNIGVFKAEILSLNLQSFFIKSSSAIQSCIIPGNQKVKEISGKLANKGFQVKPIYAPTVAQGSERLRFCIHSFNSQAQIKEVLKLLVTFMEETGEMERMR